MVNIPQIASSIASTLQYNRLPPLQIRGKRRERPQPACHLSSHISTGFSMFPLFVVFKIVHGLCRNARICRVLVCTTADGLSKKMRPIHQCYIWSTPCWQTMCITRARFYQNIWFPPDIIYQNIWFPPNIMINFGLHFSIYLNAAINWLVVVALSYSFPDFLFTHTFTETFKCLQTQHAESN